MVKNEKLKMNLAILIVTYNRSSVLTECLQSLTANTIDPDYVLIYDNCSSDDTAAVAKAWCDSQNYKTKVFLADKNKGASGGFHNGLKLLDFYPYDKVLLVDDDILFEVDAIARIKELTAPNIVYQLGRRFKCGCYAFWGGIINKHTLKVKQTDMSVFTTSEGSEVNIGCFEGMLLPKKIIESVGYPEEDFFLIDDDTYYGWKIAKKYKIRALHDVFLIRNWTSSEYLQKAQLSSVNSNLTKYLTHRNPLLWAKREKLVLTQLYLLLRYMRRIAVKFLSRDVTGAKIITISIFNALIKNGGSLNIDEVNKW